MSEPSITPDEPDLPPPPDPTGELEFLARPISRKARSALTLRLAGTTLADIVQIVGFASVKEATDAIDKALAEEMKGNPKTRDQARAHVDQKLNRLFRSVAQKAFDPKHPEHLAAVGKARELVQDHVKLFGLNSPTEITVHNPDSNEIEQWVSELQALNAPQVEEADIFAPVIEGEVMEDSDADIDS